MKGLLCKDWAILVNSYKKNFLIMVVALQKNKKQIENRTEK